MIGEIENGIEQRKNSELCFVWWNWMDWDCFVSTFQNPSAALCNQWENEWSHWKKMKAECFMTKSRWTEYPSLITRDHHYHLLIYCLDNFLFFCFILGVYSILNWLHSMCRGMSLLIRHFTTQHTTWWRQESDEDEAISTEHKKLSRFLSYLSGHNSCILFHRPRRGGSEIKSQWSS